MNHNKSWWFKTFAVSAAISIVFAGGAFFSEPINSSADPVHKPPASPTVEPEADIDLPLGEDWWVGSTEKTWDGGDFGENIIPENIDVDVPEIDESGIPVDEEAEEEILVPMSTNILEVSRSFFSLYPTTREFKNNARIRGDLGKWSDPIKLKGTLERVRKHLRQWGGKARIAKADGDLNWTRWFSRKKAVHEYAERLRTRASGSIWYVQASSNKNSHLAKIIVKTIIYDTQGTPAIDRVITALKKKFDNWSVWGIFACRAVAGTSIWSQHAYANAVDLGASSTKMREIARFLSAHRELPVSQVIYARQVWTPISGWHYYGGVNPHYDHVHVSGEPYMTGTPRCAR